MNALRKNLGPTRLSRNENPGVADGVITSNDIPPISQRDVGSPFSTTKVSMEDDIQKEYMEIVAYIKEKTDCFFWWKPKDSPHRKQYIDVDLFNNVRKRMQEGATIKQLLSVLDSQLHRLTGNCDKDRCTITTFFSKKNFWRALE